MKTIQSRFKPKLFTTFQDYSWQAFSRDFIAGIVVGIIALPLSIAFGVSSGVSPEQGLMTAIVAGFIISAFGGSRVQIGGPTGAFVVIVYDIIKTHGINGLLIATVLAGIFLVIMGLAKLGEWLKYIPVSVIVGFTSGIALTIFSGQMKDFLGLTMGDVPPHFIEKWVAYGGAIFSINPWACGLGAATIAIILFLRSYLPAVPGTFVALIVVSAFSHLFHVPVETLGTRFSTFALCINPLHCGPVDIPSLYKLITPAITIAILGAVESLLSAVVADGMIGGRHRPNTELMAQGLANIVSPLVGGIPATGAIARTAANIRAGGRTPVAGIVHAITLAAIALFIGPLISLVPMAVLAGILVIVAYNMSEWREFVELTKGPRSDMIVLLITFFGTVFFDLVVGIQAGITLSVFLFMKRMSDLSEIKKFQQELHETGDPDTFYEHDALRTVTVPNHVEVFELNGAFFFGAASKFEMACREAMQTKKTIILRLNNILEIDATGLKILMALIREAKHRGRNILLSELKRGCYHTLEKSEVLHLLGRDHIFKTLQAAVDYSAKP